MARAGRKRQDGLREASGRLQRAAAKDAEIVVPIAALVRRAEACGVDPKTIITNGDMKRSKPVKGSDPVATALCSQIGGQVLERLAWQIGEDGGKHRKLITLRGRVVEQITDGMLAAAEAYRTLWIEWYRTTGLPRRHPQGAQYGERMDKGVEVHRDPSPKRMSMIRDWLDKAEAALDRCEPRRLVWAAIDTVVIDNELPAGLEFGERSAALHALRDGLEALEVLVAGQGRKGGWWRTDGYGGEKGE